MPDTVAVALCWNIVIVNIISWHYIHKHWDWIDNFNDIIIIII